MKRASLPIFQTQLEPDNVTTTLPSNGRPETELPRPGVGKRGIDPTVEPIRSPQTLLPYLQLFWENRRLLLRTTIYSLVASILIAFLIPVQYQSVTRLMPPDSQSGMGLGLLAAVAGRSVGSGSLGTIANDLLGGQSSGALFVGIVNSESAQNALIEKFHLQKEYHARKIEDARKELGERTDVSEDRKSGIISITVTEHDPIQAAAMAQAYVAELNRLVAQVSTSSARRERIFLEGRIQKVKEDLDMAAKNFSDFASKNTAIDVPAQGKAMVEAAAILQGQLIAAQSEVSGLKEIYTENNVRVRAAEARVNELQKKLEELGGEGSLTDLQNENSLYPSIRKLPLLGVTYADLYRQTKIQETVYELLTEQYEMAKVREAKEIPTVKVLDPAMVPTKKSFPPRSVIAVVGTMLGLTLAMLWIGCKARWQEVDSEDPWKLLVVDVYTTLKARVPFLAKNGTEDPAKGAAEEQVE